MTINIKLYFTEYLDDYNNIILEDLLQCQESFYNEYFNTIGK